MGMRIIQLEAQNVKRLKAVRIAPSGAVVEITGRNAQGKTSVLDSIMYALGGEKPIPSKPIRDGEKSARVRVDLGDETVELVVERTISESGSTLKVMSPDGAKFSKAQGKLNDLIGALTFDPLEFSRMEPKKQLATLRQLTGVDFTALDQEAYRLTTERRDVNRDLKAVLAQAQAIEIPEGTPEEPIDVSAKMVELGEIRAANARVEELARFARDADACRVNAIKALAEAERMVVLAKERLKTATEKAERAARDAESQHTQDESVLVTTINEAGSVNAAVAKRKAKAELVKRAKSLEADSAKMSMRLDKIADEKAATIAKAKLPVEGLGFGEEGITYLGVPFDQCSSAEQLRVSVAMGLALNPKLRVMLIRDGSLLDEDSLRTVAEMAEAADAQIWIETVAKGEPRGFVIEDGEVATKGQKNAK